MKLVLISIPLNPRIERTGLMVDPKWIVPEPENEMNLPIVGKVYKYLPPIPRNCQGHLYKVLMVVRDVPSYQQKVVVEGLTGPDKGLGYCCTLSNFSIRFEAVKQEVSQPTTEPVNEMELCMCEGSGF